MQGTQTEKSDEFAYSERADLEPQDDNLLILGESGDALECPNWPRSMWGR